MNSRRSNVQRGVTVLELMMVVMVIAVIGLVAVTRFMRVTDQGFVAAAQSDLTSVRQAIALYAADYDVYPANLNSIADLQAAAVDRNGIPYFDLPSQVNFAWVSYEVVPGDGYVLRIQAHDHHRTVIRATANGIGLES